jgi:hypothetical protein
MQEIQHTLKTGDIKSTRQVALYKIPKYQTCCEKNSKRDHTSDTNDQSQQKMNTQAQAPQLTTLTSHMCQDTAKFNQIQKLHALC